jgi:hypothetical protein
VPAQIEINVSFRGKLIFQQVVVLIQFANDQKIASQQEVENISEMFLDCGLNRFKVTDCKEIQFQYMYVLFMLGKTGASTNLSMSYEQRWGTLFFICTNLENE